MAAASTFLAVSGLVVTLIYAGVLAHELDEELIEQLEELQASYRDGPRGEREFERLVRPLARASAETPIACVVQNQSTGAAWGPYGVDELRTWLSQTERDQVTRGPGGLRLFRGALDDELEIALVLDGSDWYGRIPSFGLVVGVVVVLGALLSMFAGRVFGTRVARQLEKVAREISGRDRRVSSEIELPVEGAPDEIRSIVEALEGTLRATRGEVERARLLSAGLAHDLRAPIQALLTSTEVALLSETLTASGKELLREHRSELRTLARTVDNLVAWGAPRVDNTSDEFVDVDLALEFDSRFRGEEEEAARRGVFLDMQKTGELRTHCDPVSLTLAVRNLVGNAITWSPRGGQVLLELVGGDREISIRVDDEGPGVPAEDRERIFTPFVRGKAAPGMRAGYGLGLAIVAFAAERHSGTVSVTASPGGGARFELKLPRQATPEIVPS